MPPTIKDVAKLAGLSPTTVSHVLRDVSTHSYTAETVSKVREAARRLGYRRSRRAAGMREGRNNCVSVISMWDIQQAREPYYSVLFRSIAVELYKSGYMTEVVRAEKVEDLGSLTKDTDGALFAVHVADSVVKAVLDEKLPAVWINTDFSDDFNCVAPEDRRGAGRVGAHLRECGYERVFYVSPPGTNGHCSIRNRREGLAEGLGGVELREMRSEEDELGEVLTAIKSGKLKKTAFAAYTDGQALGIIFMAMKMGLRISALPHAIWITSGIIAIWGWSLPGHRIASAILAPPPPVCCWSAYARTAVGSARGLFRNGSKKGIPPGRSNASGAWN